MKKNLYNSWSLIELSPGSFSCFSIERKFELKHSIQRRWEWWCVTIAVPLKCSYSCFQVNIYFLQIWVSGEKEMFLKCPQQQFLQDSTKPLEQLILGLNTTCNIFFICGDGQFMVSSADLKICNTTLQSSNIPYSFFLQAGEAKIQLGCYSMQIWVAKDGKQLAQKGQNNQLEIWPQRPRYFTAAATITMHYTPWGWNFPWGVELSIGGWHFTRGWHISGGGTFHGVVAHQWGVAYQFGGLLWSWLSWWLVGVKHRSGPAWIMVCSNTTLHLSEQQWSNKMQLLTKCKGKKPSISPSRSVTASSSSVMLATKFCSSVDTLLSRMRVVAWRPEMQIYVHSSFFPLHHWPDKMLSAQHKWYQFVSKS